MELAGVLVWGMIILFVALIVLVVAMGSFSRDRGAAPGSLTAFHDFGTAEKRRAMEMVIEQKAGKRLEEQKSGEPGGSDLGVEGDSSRRPVDQAGPERGGE